MTPTHFYQQIPDTRGFPLDLYEAESPLLGIDIREDEQLLLLKKFSKKYRDEYDKFRFGGSDDEDVFYFENNAFETIDAEILYCMVRELKPANIIEIGSGYSTRVTAMAIRQNRAEDSSYSCGLTCIEPYPMDWLTRIPEVSYIIESKVETLPIGTFSCLGENDILFIDSSHTINVYNDVCFEYLEVLPSLNNGVHIHIHDIILPLRYSEYWYNMRCFWNEQYLLQAFLAFNSSFRVRWAANYMHLKHPSSLAEAFSSYSQFKNSPDLRKRSQGHKSFWIQKSD